MSDSWRPPSDHTVLCKLHFSQFLTKWILLEICLLCLMYLPFLATQIDYLSSNIMRGACYGTIYRPLFHNLLFSILKWDRAIPAVYAALYSLSALDWEIVPGTCGQLSSGPPWYYTIYAHVIMTVSGQSWQIESDNTINWF